MSKTPIPGYPDIPSHPIDPIFQINPSPWPRKKLAHNSVIYFTTGDGNYCLTCGSDKTVKLWNPHTGLLLKTYVGHGQEVLDTDR